MSYQVLARKWRPRNFTEMVGQEHVQRTLVNALDNNQLHHAFLFTGTRGVGKTTVARILAKSLNCEKGVTSTPCGECSACRGINDGRFVDLIEVDAASKTKVEDTRELLENVQYTPSQGRYKVYLIDEVHMLSASSFNALLKTLEEPPPHVKFLFATTDPQRLPVTILSRCLQFNLKRIPVDTISQYLANILSKEKIKADPNALLLIARAADGSMRDALSLVDQAIAYGKGQLIESDVSMMLGTIDKNHVIALLDALARHDASGLLELTRQIEEQAYDFSNVLAELTSLLHELALAQMVPDALDNSTENRQKITELAALLAPEDIQLYYQIAIIGRRDLPLAPDLRSGFEMILLRMLAFKPDQVQPAAINQSANTSANTSGSQTASTNTPRTAVKATTPGIATSGKQTAGTKTDAVTNTITDSNKNANPWHDMVSGLNLSGLTLQLANQCILKEKTDDVIHLQLDAAHTQLLNDQLQQRLQQALQSGLQRPVQLKITSANDFKDETPAQQQKRNQDERQQTAQDTIQQDTNVQALIDTFGAKVDTKSIKPTG